MYLILKMFRWSNHTRRKNGDIILSQTYKIFKDYSYYGWHYGANVVQHEIKEAGTN